MLFAWVRSNSKSRNSFCLPIRLTPPLKQYRKTHSDNALVGRGAPCELKEARTVCHPQDCTIPRMVRHVDHDMLAIDISTIMRLNSASEASRFGQPCNRVCLGGPFEYHAISPLPCGSGLL